MGDPKHSRPVFFDPTGRRAKATNLTLAAVALTLAFAAAVITFTVSFGSTHVVFRVRQSRTARRTLPSSYLLTPTAGPRITFTQSRKIPTSDKKALRIAFVAVATAADLVPLKKHAKNLDAIIGNWLELLSTPGGFHLRELRGKTLVVGWLRDHDRRVLIFPEINDYLTSAQMSVLLSHKEMRFYLVDEIAKYLAKNKFPGVVLDTRNIPTEVSRGMALLVGELEAKLRSAKRKLLLLVAPTTSTRQLRTLASLADYIIAATYNEHRGDRTTGAPAGEGWFEKSVRHFVTAVPSSKLIISIGSYCLDTDLAGWPAVVSVQRGWDIMAHKHARMMFAGNSLNGSFTYHDGQGMPHRAWLLDGVTVFNQTKVALAAAPAGIALWRLGLEDPGAWRSFSRGSLPNSAALAALKSPHPGFGAFGPVKAVLLRAEPGHVGKRSLSYDRGLGLIVNEHMERLPSAADISTLHAKGTNLVALTFDDGPDPRYTGRILDILAQKHVKASFFVIGRQALIWPNLVKREYLAGGDVGNHTFSHPNPERVSAVRLAVELNANARIIRSITGAQVHLFRPPYAGPGFGYLNERPEAAVEATKLGYVIAGLGVETCDYCGVSPSWIVHSATDGIVYDHRHVILLHDGGGNRDATIAALPKIIDLLRADGYRFVTMHQLVGLSRAAVLQPIAPVAIVSRLTSTIWQLSIVVVGWVSDKIPGLAFWSAVIGVLRLMLVALLAIFQSQRRDPAGTAAYRGPVAVLVPAYNEQPTICKTVGSLLASTVTESIEVVVIDDGSTDGTLEALMAEFHGDKRVRAIRKKNGGKASALNVGIASTIAPVIVAIDGDTILLPDAIERLTMHFSDPSVGAVAGNVKVGNRRGLITAFQALEYITSQNLDRRAFELFNAVGVVPGAIGAWRRAALEEVGGYSADTLAEDAELTFTVERRGWRVVCEPGAYALTEAPETLSAFLKQRFRWMYGTLQATTKHSRALFQRPRGFSLITIPNVYIFQFGFTLIAPLMDVLLIWALVPFILAFLLGVSMPEYNNLLLIAQYWAALQTADLIAAAIGIALNKERGYWHLLPLVLLQRFTYRMLLYVTAFKALGAALKGTFTGWGKLARTGSVPNLHHVHSVLRE